MNCVWSDVVLWPCSYTAEMTCTLTIFCGLLSVPKNILLLSSPPPEKAFRQPSWYVQKLFHMDCYIRLSAQTLFDVHTSAQKLVCMHCECDLQFVTGSWIELYRTDLISPVCWDVKPYSTTTTAPNALATSKLILWIMKTYCQDRWDDPLTVCYATLTLECPRKLQTVQSHWGQNDPINLMHYLLQIML